MNRKVIGMLVGAALVAGLGTGYYFRGDTFNPTGNEQQKPALHASNTEIKIDANTPIIFEKEYIRSQKVVISEFHNSQDIIGYTLEEIRSQYSDANGFTVSFKEGSLSIRQTINDWSPEDKAKCRFKEYQGRVAVYQGPDKDNDSLLKVTTIKFSALPENIRETIRQGQYEFQNEDAANDALENLDEYL